MRDQIKSIFNSKASELSILLIVCCMIVITLTKQQHGEWTGVAAAASLIGGIVLISLLAWATIMIITKKKVIEMPIKSRLIIESISRLLLLYWIYITMGLIAAAVWSVFILWDGVRSIREVTC